MSLVEDDHALACDTVAEVTPLIRAVLPNAHITSDCFDAYVRLPGRHGIAEIERDAFAAARSLRGGRDVDRKLIADWHLRCAETVQAPEGAWIWLSRTYPVPDGYHEAT